MEENAPLIFIAINTAKFKPLCNCDGLKELGSPKNGKSELLGYSKTNGCLEPVVKENIGNYSLFIVEDHISKDYVNKLFDTYVLQKAFLLKHDETNKDFISLFANNKIVSSHEVTEESGVPTVYAQVAKDINNKCNVYERVRNHIVNALQTASNCQNISVSSPLNP